MSDLAQRHQVHFLKVRLRGTRSNREGLGAQVTRAKRRLTLVSSFSSRDVDPERVTKPGARLLADYLAYADSGGTASEASGGTTLNPFEAARSSMGEAYRTADLGPLSPCTGGTSLPSSVFPNGFDTASGIADLDQNYVQTHFNVRPGRYVSLSVSDTGAGMTQDTKNHLFEPFFTTKEVGKGTGLGLATVHGIVRQHGGSIRVYSAPGEGTTFKIYLPETDEPLDAAPAGASGAQGARGAERILLVEDDPDVRALTETVLERGGYEVIAARDGDEALRVFRDQGRPVHLLVSDVVMPKMSGRELAERLRALQADLKVLYVSGYTQEALGRHGVLEPGIVLLPKPFQPVAMLDKVREMLDTRPQRGR